VSSDAYPYQCETAQGRVPPSPETRASTKMRRLLPCAVLLSVIVGTTTLQAYRHKAAALRDGNSVLLLFRTPIGLNLSDENAADRHWAFGLPNVTVYTCREVCDEPPQEAKDPRTVPDKGPGKIGDLIKNFDEVQVMMSDESGGKITLSITNGRHGFFLKQKLEFRGINRFALVPRAAPAPRRGMPEEWTKEFELRVNKTDQAARKAPGAEATSPPADGATLKLTIDEIQVLRGREKFGFTRKETSGGYFLIWFTDNHFHALAPRQP
jgi:hypothetical protein